MTIGIGDNLSKSFAFAKDSLVGKWLEWLILCVLTIIPIVNFIAIGTYLKIFRGEEPKFNASDIAKAFIDGLMVFIIMIIFMIVPLILTVILSIIPIIGTLLGLVIMIALLLFAIPAVYGYAQSGFGAAFAFKDHLAAIKNIGWGNYILAVVVVALIFGLFSVICGIIPVIGWLVMLVGYPFIFIFACKYIANLFA